MERQVLLVDIFDKPLGYETKEAAHANGLLHRAYSIFLHRDGQMLLQKRAKHKYHSGGLWTNACCSHPLEGTAVERQMRQRLREELDIDCLVELHKLFDFVYYHQFSETLFEYEFDHVYAGEYRGVVLPNPEEAEEIRWVWFSELAACLTQKPHLFSPWFRIAAPKVLQLLSPGSFLK